MMRTWLMRRRRGGCTEAQREPSTIPELPARGPKVYRDGTYLISAFGGSRTWAVYYDGRWGVVYEWLGEQPLGGWVASDQIPLEIRAQALRRPEDLAR
jgi:hypothetical protein